jgi:hypothetical protein
MYSCDRTAALAHMELATSLMIGRCKGQEALGKAVAKDVEDCVAS